MFDNPNTYRAGSTSTYQATWKRRPGRPRGRWIDQLRRDNNRPPADQWKLAIKRGHGGRATLLSNDYATT